MILCHLANYCLRRRVLRRRGTRQHFDALFAASSDATRRIVLLQHARADASISDLASTSK